jgi:hypothetical protein
LLFAALVRTQNNLQVADAVFKVTALRQEQVDVSNDVQCMPGMSLAVVSRLKSLWELLHFRCTVYTRIAPADVQVVTVVVVVKVIM